MGEWYPWILCCCRHFFSCHTHSPCPCFCASTASFITSLFLFPICNACALSTVSEFFIHCIWTLYPLYLNSLYTVSEFFIHCIWILYTLYLNSLSTTVSEFFIHCIWILYPPLYLNSLSTVSEFFIHCIWILYTLYRNSLYMTFPALPILQVDDRDNNKINTASL